MLGLVANSTCMAPGFSRVPRSVLALFGTTIHANSCKDDRCRSRRGRQVSVHNRRCYIQPSRFAPSRSDSSCRKTSRKSRRWLPQLPKTCEFEASRPPHRWPSQRLQCDHRADRPMRQSVNCCARSRFRYSLKALRRLQAEDTMSVAILIGASGSGKTTIAAPSGGVSFSPARSSI